MGKAIKARLKWYFVGAVALLFGMFFMLPHLCCDDGRDVRLIIRQSSLRTVAYCVLDYPDRHDGLLLKPDHWLDGGLTDVYPEPIFGDDDQDNIWMCPIPWPDERIPADLSKDDLAQIPMIHEKMDLDSAGTSVAFWDGSIRRLSDEEFTALINIEDSVCLGCQGMAAWGRVQKP